MEYKCKVCGGTLEIKPSSNIAKCEYCGTKQTIPVLDTEKKERLFTKALDYRLESDFDRAYNTYETIINEEPTEPEAYWGALLSDYGIEYVKDAYSDRMIPTCHRTKYRSILEHEYYKKAIEYANEETRELYKDEAQDIDRIQSRILNIASREDPFDVFICYKETDEKGRRTQDSVLANEIYYQLTQEGYKVFFAAITLEDKLGTEYEPYIFSAINSAKVMLVVGTTREYFEAVWVRNEWTRFLELAKEDRKRLLIPCYRNMDAYDLPEEFGHLQSQDMSKLGFMQDLIRGIKKIVPINDSKEKAVNKEEIKPVEKKPVEKETDRSFIANIYDSANKEMAKNTRKGYERAAGLLQTIISYKDSKDKIAVCEKKLKAKSLTLVTAIVAIALAISGIFIYGSIGKYDEGENIIEEEKDTQIDTYNEAVNLYNSGNYSQAYKEFIKIDYSDSKELANSCLYYLQGNTVSGSSYVGKTVKFGWYEQDNNLENGKEEIEWTVIDIRLGSALLLSNKVLDGKPYNDPMDYVTWDKSSIREWLNDEFYNEAFSKEAQSLILNTTSSSDYNPNYKDAYGNTVTDKVFLLTGEEANTYITSSEERKRMPTEYAKANGCFQNKDDKKCMWWVRTPGLSNYYAAGVLTGGDVYYYGFPVMSVFMGVVPAIWVSTY